jgi:ferredoxin
MKLGEAVTTGEVRRNVDLAVGVANLVDGGEAAVGGFVLEVEPLHLLVVGAVVEQHFDRCVRVRNEVGPAAARHVSEGEHPADHAEKLELRDGVIQQSRRDGHGEEETVAPPTEARNLGAVLGRVRVGEVAAKHGLGGMGRGCWGRGRCGGCAVTARRGEQGRDPLVDLEAAEVRKTHHALGVAVEPPVRLVERIHDEPPRVHDADDVLQEPGEFAVVAEAHRRVGVDERPQGDQGLERLGLRNDEGSDYGIGEGAEPRDGAAGLSFIERRHLDADGRRDVTPVAQHREGAVDT